MVVAGHRLLGSPVAHSSLVQCDQPQVQVLPTYHCGDRVVNTWRVNDSMCVCVCVWGGGVVREREGWPCVAVCVCEQGRRGGRGGGEGRGWRRMRKL